MADGSSDTGSILQISESIDVMLKEDKLDEKRVVDLLEKLKSSEMTLSSLHQTGIGRNVNKLRKALASEELVTQCKNLLKSWKKLLAPTPAPEAVKRKSIEEPTAVQPAKQQKPSTNSEGESASQANLSDYLLEKLGVGLEDASPSDLSVRLKCREMLTRALHSGMDSDSVNLADIAIRIERAIFEDTKSTTSSKYRSHIRSKVFNLKDSKNPTLRQRVKKGEISPERFARMTADELASDEMKMARQQMTKEAIDEHQMVLTGGTVTDLLKCDKCKKNNCTYTQVQTRSADEPMTTFAFCNECGHRWKFE